MASVNSEFSSARKEAWFPRVLFAVLIAAVAWLLINVVMVTSGAGLMAAGPLSGRGVPLPVQGQDKAIAVLNEPPSTGSAAGIGADARPANRKLGRPNQLREAIDEAAATSRAEKNTELGQSGKDGLVNSDQPGSQPARANAEVARGQLEDKSLPRQIEYLTVLVALCGALGATLYGLGSLVAFVGNGKFVQSWSMWHLAQPIRGAVLAMGFYWAFNGGWLGDSGKSEAPKMSSAAMGLMFMVGLFSDLALEKLREVFQVLFRTGGKARNNPLDGDRKPTVAKARFNAERPVTQVELDGDGFESTDEVTVNNRKQPVLTRTAKSLEIALDQDLTVTGTKLNVVVRPTQRGALDSDVVELTAP